MEGEEQVPMGDAFTVDLENDDFEPDVMSLAVGSFAEYESPSDDEQNPGQMRKPSSPKPPRTPNPQSSHRTQASRKHKSSPHMYPPPFPTSQYQDTRNHYTFGYRPTPYNWGPGPSVANSHWNSPHKYELYAASQSKSHGSPSRAPSPVLAEFTPEKQKPRRDDPFRSPLSNKKSPFSFASPALGEYGSFSMDTPSGMLGNDFSPMGSYDEYRHPTQLDASVELPLSHHLDFRSEGIATVQSPIEFINTNFSPLVPGPTQSQSRSPHLSAQRTAVLDYRSNPVRPTTANSAASVRRDIRPVEATDPKRQLYPAAPTGSSPTIPVPTASGNAMRLELGHRSLTTQQRLLDGINNKIQRSQPPQPQVRQQQPPPLPPPPPPPPPSHSGQHHHHFHSHHPSPAPHMVQASSYHGAHPAPDFRTPYPRHPHGYAAPVSHRHQNVPSSQTPAKENLHHILPPGPSKQSSASKKVPPAQVGISSYRSTSDPKATPAKLNKENQKSVAPQGSDKKKHSPCNCKKSKCLKLYCECFSAELYCNGCNCADCKNVPQFEDVRAKAVKETKAKNPGAFMEKIANSHNTGCRCKRSECLKKYCEVSSNLWLSGLCRDNRVLTF